MPFALALLLLLPAFDKVLLKDGRLIVCNIVASEDPDTTTIELQGIEIPIHNDLIDKTYVEDLENYVPKNKKEEEYLAKGWVLFEGSWMSESRREKELDKRRKEDDEAIRATLSRQSWRNAVTIETPHFEITSTLDEDVLEEYVDNLEEYYKHFTEFWGIKLSPGDKQGKPKVFLYRNYDQYGRSTGYPSNVLGFFNPIDVELHLFHQQGNPKESMETMFHEGNHLLTHMIDPGFRYPIWLNEGMAEYYGAAVIDDKGRVSIGAVQGDRIVELNEDLNGSNMMSLRDVLLTPHKHFSSRHYAYSWSFIHFLMQSKDHSRTFKGFFGNLANNKDLVLERSQMYGYDRASIQEPTLETTLAAFEKRMKTSVEKLEEEWRAYISDAYGEVGPTAHWDAAWLALRNPKDDDSHVLKAVAHYEKAVELGIQSSTCYRQYAELLRKGGIMTPKAVHIPLEPNPEKAWELITRAIELDPVRGVNYMEAAGILLMDGPIQDIDKCVAMAETAKALEPRNDAVTSLYNSLMAKVEPAREILAKRAELAAADHRLWMVLPDFPEGAAPPDRMEDLSTDALKELIRSGKVGKRDWIFQSRMVVDAETGEESKGSNPWDNEWVRLEDIPDFAEDLAAAES